MTQPSQHWQPETYAGNARFVADYGTPLIDLLAPQPHEYIMDLGCGDGVLTQKIMAYGCRVLGVDGSAALVAAAQANGVNAVWQDGQKLTYHQEFDAIFSNAALHWMTDAAAVVRGVSGSLKTGGRFVGEFGGAGNIAAIQAALTEALAKQGLQPRRCWYFPSAEEYGDLLAQHGFCVQHIALYSRPTPLPTGVAGWLAAFGEPMLPENLTAAQRETIFTQAAALAEQQLPQENGSTIADYVRLRFVARKAA